MLELELRHGGPIIIEEKCAVGPGGPVERCGEMDHQGATEEAVE